MCDACGIDHPEINPEDVAGAISMGLADEANFRDRVNEQRARLLCLELAVRVKGIPDPLTKRLGSSKDVIASASAYYDFVMGKNNRKNDNDTSVSR